MRSKVPQIVSESAASYGSKAKRTKSETKRPLTRADPDWNPERKNFWNMFEELMKTHRDEYVAIYGGQVVASGKDGAEIALAAIKQFGNVPIFVSRVTRERPVAYITSLREISKDANGCFYNLPRNKQ